MTSEQMSVITSQSSLELGKTFSPINRKILLDHLLYFYFVQLLIWEAAPL